MTTIMTASRFDTLTVDSRPCMGNLRRPTTSTASGEEEDDNYYAYSYEQPSSSSSSDNRFNNVVDYHSAPPQRPSRIVSPYVSNKPKIQFNNEMMMTNSDDDFEAPLSDGGEQRERQQQRRPARRRASIQFGGGNESSSFPDYGYGDAAPTIKNNNSDHQRQRPQRRRSIQFAQVDEVQEVEPMKNLTRKPENLWYQPDEIRSIQNKNKQIIEKKLKNESCETTSTRKLCTRGLESSFCPGKRYKKQLRIWESIKGLQNFQKTRGIYDDEIISEIYRRSSEDDMREAAQRALEDAEHILKQQQPRVRASRRRSCGY